MVPKQYIYSYWQGKDLHGTSTKRVCKAWSIPHLYTDLQDMACVRRKRLQENNEEGADKAGVQGGAQA